jgi:hypothetical protein
MKPLLVSIIGFIAFFMGVGGMQTQNTNDSERQEIQQGINNYINDFSVELSPWNESGTRAQAAITNRSGTTYNDVVFRLALVEDNGRVTTTEETGAYSHLYPEETVHYYVDLADVSKTAGYVYSVSNNHFGEL